MISALRWRRAAPISISRCITFNNRIQECHLMDLGFIGPKFTWKGPKLNNYDRVFERLNRGLCNMNWRLYFSKAVVRVLPRIHFSDHNPILAISGVKGRISHKKTFFILRPPGLFMKLLMLLCRARGERTIAFYTPLWSHKEEEETFHGLARGHSNKASWPQRSTSYQTRKKYSKRYWINSYARKNPLAPQIQIELGGLWCSWL